MSTRTTKEILEYQTELRRRIDLGIDVIDVADLRQPEGLGTDHPTTMLQQRKIEANPSATGS